MKCRCHIVIFATLHHKGITVLAVTEWIMSLSQVLWFENSTPQQRPLVRHSFISIWSHLYEEGCYFCQLWQNLRTCTLKAVKAEQEVCKAWWVRDTVCVVVLQHGFTFSVIRLTLEVCLQSVWSSGHSHFLPNCSLVKPNCYISKSRQLTTEHILS